MKQPRIVVAAIVSMAGLLAGKPAGAAVDVHAVRNGEQVYARCAACHSVEANRTGPLHCGLFGRRAGAASGFTYSQAMRDSTIVWDAKTLDRFIKDPMMVIPGTTMTYAGVKQAKERADLIAFLAEATVPGKSCVLPKP